MTPLTTSQKTLAGTGAVLLAALATTIVATKTSAPRALQQSMCETAPGVTTMLPMVRVTLLSKNRKQELSAIIDDPSLTPAHSKQLALAVDCAAQLILMKEPAGSELSLGAKEWLSR